MRESVRAVIENHQFIDTAFENMPTDDVAKVWAMAHHVRTQIFDKNDLLEMLEYPHTYNEDQINRVWRLLHVSSMETESYLAKVQKSGGLDINAVMDDFERFCFFYNLAHKIWQAVIGLGILNNAEYRNLLRTSIFLLTSQAVIPLLRQEINKLIKTSEEMAEVSNQQNILGEPDAYSWLGECAYAPSWTGANSQRKFEEIERQKTEEIESIMNE